MDAYSIVGLDEWMNGLMLAQWMHMVDLDRWVDLWLERWIDGWMNR